MGVSNDPRSATGETHFSLAYGYKAVTPEKIVQESWWIREYNEKDNEANLALELDLLEEKRQRATVWSELYNAKMARYYNRRLKEMRFQVGDLVLCRIEAS